MPSTTSIRLQIESALAHKIPSALSPPVRTIRPLSPTGIPAIDDILEGGLPIGALTEVVGAECSGRTSLALSFVAQLTQAGKVCAWIDASDNLHPESAAAMGVDLMRLLWVRCGVPAQPSASPSCASNFALPEKYFVAPPIKKGLHGGGFGPHPRNEIKGISGAVSAFLNQESFLPPCPEPQHKIKVEKEIPTIASRQITSGKKISITRKPWSRLDQALQVTDLLLQAGGFSAIVLDLGSIGPEFALRVPLATWFRYRACAERSQSAVLLLTQHACAKSSAGLVLRLQPNRALLDEATVFTGLEYCVEVARERFKQPVFNNVIDMRKQPRSERHASWITRTSWANPR